MLPTFKIEWSKYESNFNKETIQHFEKQAGIVFPDLYKKDMLNTGAGSPDPSYFYYHNKNGERLVERMGRFLSFDNEDENMMQIYLHTRESLPEHIIPIAFCYPENTLCFDYGKGKQEPEVILWVTEYDERKDMDVDHFYPVAPSYEDFLLNLHFDIQWTDVIDLPSERIIEDLRSLEKEWNIRFPENYVQIVLHYHGGKPDKTLFSYGPEDVDTNIEYFLRVDRAANNGVLAIYQQHDKLNKLYPFAMCEDGNVLCHDYRRSDPMVTLWHVEEQTDYPLNRTFTSFMDDLF